MKPAIRLVLLLVVLVVVAMVYPRFRREKGAREEYNRIVTELVEAGRHEEAIPKLEALQKKGSEDLAAAVRHSLAVCHRELAHAEKGTSDQMLSHLRAAERLDPEVLSDEDREALKAGQSGSNPPGR